MKQFHTKERENSGNCACFTPAHEPSFGARPVPGRSGSDSLLVPEPSPSRRLHSDPLRAGTSRAPDAGGFRGARRDKSSGRSLQGERAVRASVLLTFFPPCERTGLRVTRQQPRRAALQFAENGPEFTWEPFISRA